MQAFEAADIPSAKCERRTTLTANAQIQAIGALETYVTENLGQLTAPTPPALFAGAATSLAEPSPIWASTAMRLCKSWISMPRR